MCNYIWVVILVKNKVQHFCFVKYIYILYIYIQYIYTVGTESIQTPLNFSLFVILQPFAKIS